MKTPKLSLIATGLLGLTACAQHVDLKGSTSTTGVTPSARAFAARHGSMAAQAAETKKKVVCIPVAVNVPVQEAEVDDNGDFTISIPKNIPVACYLEDAITGERICSLLMETRGTYSLHDPKNPEKGKTLSLDSDTSVRDVIQCDADRGLAFVDNGGLGPTSTPESRDLSLAALHDRSFSQECIKTGYEPVDEYCKKYGAHGRSYYTRIMLGQDKNGHPFQGMGFWATKSSFMTCGSVDLPAKWLAPAGVTLGQGKAGSFSFDSYGLGTQAVCRGPSWTMADVPKAAILIEKAIIAGDSWNVVWNVEPDFPEGGKDCKLAATQVVAFRPDYTHQFEWIALVETTIRPSAECDPFGQAQSMASLTGTMLLGFNEAPQQ